jgi:hypothetical protein
MNSKPFLLVIALIALAGIIGIEESTYRANKAEPISIESTPSAGASATSKPVATAKAAVTTPPVKSSTGTDGPYIGMQLSWDDGLYFLGGGGKIGGVSTTKYRYKYWSKFYVVYCDNDIIVRKVEDYLPGLSSKGKSSSGKDESRQKTSDPYNASSYRHPDDFYYDHYDDFWDYEDAEDYWERHH